MKYKFSEILKGDRKFFAIVFFLFLLLLITGFISPILIDNKINNWDNISQSKIENIQNEVTDLLISKGKNLENELLKIKNYILEFDKNNTTKVPTFNKLKNEIFNSGYFIEIYSEEDEIVLWNKVVFGKIEIIQNLPFNPGETFFHNGNLNIYYSIYDTLETNQKKYFLAISIPIEKKYRLQNQFFISLNISDELSEKYNTQFNISYSPFAGFSKDGREFSFDIINNRDNKIGVVHFFILSLENATNRIKIITSNIQTILALLGFIFLSIVYRKEIIILKSRIIKSLILFIYLSVFRAILFMVDFPSGFMDGMLTDSNYFSSVFAWGIVKSPIEFFITTLFFLFFTIRVSYYIINYTTDELSNKNFKKWILIVQSITILLITLFSLRGIAATLRSVVFDSTLRYFKETELIPELPAIVMHLSNLLLAFGSVLLLAALIYYLFVKISKVFVIKKVNLFFIFFIVFQVTGLLFVLIQVQPLINPLLSFIFLSIIFSPVYLFFIKGKNNVLNYVLMLLGGSIISVTLLNYFNTELEAESLKTTAFELNRPNENLFRFMITETLYGAVELDETFNSLKKVNANYDATAFIIWSRSSLHKESMNSSVTILDRRMRTLGSFGIEIDPGLRTSSELLQSTGSYPYIIEKEVDSKPGQKVFSGIIPVRDQKTILGYIVATVLFDRENFGDSRIPSFLSSRTNILNSIVDFKNLKIFDFFDKKLERVYGEIVPNAEQIERIIGVDFEGRNDAWLNLNFGSESYLVYILKTLIDDDERIVAVCIKDKSMSWSLYNFFKVFFIHSLFIILVLFVYMISKYRSFTQYRYSFKAQLLVGFLVVSIIPILALAVYNRKLTSEQIEATINNELRERIEYVENHINVQRFKNPQREQDRIFYNAGVELKIDFNVFQNKQLRFTSQEQFYNAGLFPSIINYNINYKINELGFREIFTNEYIDKYSFNSFYKKIIFDDEEFIFSVNDSHSRVNIAFTAVDTDIFLFGSYTFAILMIIIVSTILANKISSPIQRLTKATKSVAHGDFIELQINEGGEIKELLNGFNAMTRDLKKSQVELAELERENAWKEMARQVAHEIKNPLTPMKLAMQQLNAAYRDNSPKFGEIFTKLYDTILNQINTLSNIAAEFSRFGRMPNLKLEKFDMLPIINETLTLFTDENVQVKLETHFNEVTVEADKDQLRRMFINLIRNSLQADANLVTISIIDENENFLIKFIDNGSGIPEEFKNKIFSPNFTTKEKGMGLGLKLSKRFVEGINGLIELESTSEAGTVFKIILPKS